MAPDENQEPLRSLKFVGPATASVLEAAGVAASDVTSKAVTHAEIVDHGVNPGVAARIRREHSLQWSFEGGADLDQRAEQVRGLQADEREWVAASHGEDEASTDGSGDATAEEAAWRDQPADSGGAGAGDRRSATDDGTTEESTWQAESWPNGDDRETALERSEQAWRERSTPTPVTELDEIADGDAKLLARAGVTSVRSLTTAHVERVADSLRIDEDLVVAWKESAREHED